jgi:hypothetical protein
MISKGELTSDDKIERVSILETSDYLCAHLCSATHSLWEIAAVLANKWMRKYSSTNAISAFEDDNTWTFLIR